MPRVRFLAPVATAERSYQEREVAEIPGPHASAWAKAGLVEIVRGSEDIEQPPSVATVNTPEGDKPPVTTPERTEAPTKKAAPKPRKPRATKKA